MRIRIGIIGDTHGIIHPSVPMLLLGVDQIVHTGDIGGSDVLAALERIAPVIAVKGNYDIEPDLQDQLLPDPSRILIGGHSVFLTHRMFTMDWNQTKGLIAQNLNRGGKPPRFVIFGHTHFPILEEIQGIWFVNPGYAGPDPLEGPPTAALVDIHEKEISGDIVHL